MTTPLCAGCERPAHASPCYPEITAPLFARIADLERQLAAAITHPLAVAALETHAALRGDLKSSTLLDAAIKADHAWTDAGRPLRATEVPNG